MAFNRGVFRVYRASFIHRIHFPLPLTPLHLAHPGRLPLTCSADGSTVYVAAVHACLPAQLASDDEMQSVLTQVRVCPGGVFTDAAAMQRLRYCMHVQETLVLQGVQGPIDASVLWDIDSIEGQPVLSMRILVLTDCPCLVLCRSYQPCVVRIQADWWCKTRCMWRRLLGSASCT